MIRSILRKTSGSDVEPSVTRRQIFERHWLDVEDAYREAGWGVTYEKPSYNEDGMASFVFVSRQKGE